MFGELKVDTTKKTKDLINKMISELTRGTNKMLAELNKMILINTMINQFSQAIKAMKRYQREI